MLRKLLPAFLAFIVASILIPDIADAQRRRRRRRQRARQAQAEQPQEQAQQELPLSEGISNALGEVRWGMSSRDVARLFAGKIRERYRALQREATGQIEQDRLHRQMERDIQRIRRDFTRFNGEMTGFEASFLRGHFTHNNNETMLVIEDEQAKNYFFFINNRLWKWYRAFNASIFGGFSFEQFAQALNQRFGESRERTEPIFENTDRKHWLEWHDPTTHLRAIDENRFYGFYCLVFTEKATLANIDSLRTNRPDDGPRRHAIVDAVTNGQESSDGNRDVADRITGNRRINRQAPVEEEGDDD